MVRKEALIGAEAEGVGHAKVSMMDRGMRRGETPCARRREACVGEDGGEVGEADNCNST